MEEMANNPLFNLLNSGKNIGMQGPLGNMANMMQQFGQFRKSFKGNPKEQVQELLRSGKMSNEQFEQLKGMAQQFKGMLK